MNLEADVFFDWASLKTQPIVKVRWAGREGSRARPHPDSVWHFLWARCVPRKEVEL